MKAKILAAVTLAIAGATAASALGPFQTDRRAPPILVEAPADRGVCALRSDAHTLSAFAAPLNAASWSLDVRSPGFTAAQGGPLFGDDRAPSRVSRIVLVRDPGRGASHARSGPLHAELTVFDHDGRVICEDRLIRRPARW